MRRTDVVKILCVVGVKGRHGWRRDTEGRVQSELDGLFGQGERSRSLTTQKVQVQFVVRTHHPHTSNLTFVVARVQSAVVGARMSSALAGILCGGIDLKGKLIRVV